MSKSRLKKHLSSLALALAVVMGLLFFKKDAMQQVQAQSQQSRPKIALLIGNGAYRGDISPLQNPLRDIETIKKALLKTGFQQRNIIMVRNGGFRAIHRAVGRYIRALKRSGRNTIGFFYYSGHGAVNRDTKINYLIPTDIKVSDTDELWDSSIQLQTIIDKLRSRASNATHFVVFDACRNSLKLNRPGSKALFGAKGFEPVRKVRGMLIAYATADGETAADASAYADALASELVRPGVEAVTMFRKVQLKVARTLGQEPWLTYGALGATYFAGQRKPVRKPNAGDGVRQAWLEVRNSNDSEDLQAFIAQFGKQYRWYGRKARKRLNKLKEKKVAIGRYPKRPDPSLDRLPYEPEVKFVKGGTFQMGSNNGDSDEKPVHRVTVGSFYMGKYETTVGEYMACVKAGKCRAPQWKEKGSEYNAKTGSNNIYRKLGRALTGDRYPIVGVSWNDAVAFAKWLSRKTGQKWRLPTEAEWEYAARGDKDGNNKTKYSWGNSIGRNKANCDSDCGDKWRYTSPVGSFHNSANGFGLYDMHGNVWEWVHDWKGKYKSGDQTDPKGPRKGSLRVFRGGSWHYFARYLRSANRSSNSPGIRSINLGFRLLRQPS